ncbi:Phosphatase IMPL1, chloroplastic [Linum perenne]
MAWNTRTFSATAGGGAFCNGQRIHASQTDMVERSLLVTGFGSEHDDAWSTNIELFKEFYRCEQGCEESLGAASVDMCPVALGIVEAYWEYRLKPWDMAAGVLVNFMSSIQMSFVHQEKYGGLYSLLLRLQRIKAVQICFQAGPTTTDPWCLSLLGLIQLKFPHLSKYMKYRNSVRFGSVRFIQGLSLWVHEGQDK